MTLLHRHVWSEVRRTYNEGGLDRAHRLGWSSVNSGTFASQDAYDRWVYGFTNIELRCNECGKVKVISACGDVPASEQEQTT